MRGVFVVILLFFFISPLPAQTTKETNQPRPGTVRVAVVNVAVVFHKYEKAQAFKQEVDGTLAPFKVHMEKLTQEMKEWKKAIDDGDFKDHPEGELQASIKNNQRELVNLNQTIKRRLGKKQEENLVMLWQEVCCGVRAYAAENGIELVIGYGDSMDRDLLDLFPNVSRKMHALEGGSNILLFMTPRVDIGDAVVTRLNREYRDKQAKMAKAKRIDLE